MALDAPREAERGHRRSKDGIYSPARGGGGKRGLDRTIGGAGGLSVNLTDGFNKDYFSDAPENGGGASGSFESEVAIGLGRGEGKGIEA